VTVTGDRAQGGPADAVAAPPTVPTAGPARTGTRNRRTPAVPAAQERETRPEPGGSPRLRVTRIGALAALIVGLLVGVLAADLTATRNPTYSSTAVLLTDQPRALSLADGDGIVLKLARLRLKYIGLVSTPVITTPVARELGRSPSNLGGMLAGIAPAQNININVVAVSADKSLAPRLAQAAAQELSAYATREQQANGIAEKDQFELTLISPASAPLASVNGKHRPIYVGVGAGILAAAAAAAASSLMRRRT
jgi:hypothetical protein